MRYRKSAQRLQALLQEPDAEGGKVESVWDYPRPPRMEDCARQVQIFHHGVAIAYSRDSKRVLETSHPPVYYLPQPDIRMELLRPSRRTTFCEWKSVASYYDVVVDQHVTSDAAWSYPNPSPNFEGIRDYVAFCPSRMEACYVDGQQVRSQEGDFYGGWITSDIQGPFKGAPGTRLR